MIRRQARSDSLYLYRPLSAAVLGVARNAISPALCCDRMWLAGFLPKNRASRSAFFFPMRLVSGLPAQVCLARLLVSPPSTKSIFFRLSGWQTALWLLPPFSVCVCVWQACIHQQNPQTKTHLFSRAHMRWPRKKRAPTTTDQRSRAAPLQVVTEM